MEGKIILSFLKMNALNIFVTKVLQGLTFSLYNANRKLWDEDADSRPAHEGPLLPKGSHNNVSLSLAAWLKAAFALTSVSEESHGERETQNLACPCSIRPCIN